MRPFVPLQYRNKAPNLSTGMTILSVPITASLHIHLHSSRLNEIILYQSHICIVVTDLFLYLKIVMLTTVNHTDSRTD